MLDRADFKVYIHYSIPSIASFLLTGIYSIVDGLFVGHAVGDAGLAGINVAWPLVAFMMAIGTGVGMGGAVISSIYAGIGDLRSSNRAIAHTLSMLALATPLVMVVLFCFGQQLIYLFGGRDEILSQSQSYLSVMTWGSLFQIMASGCIPLMRNKGRVVAAMVILVISGLLNVALDFALVMLAGWGVAGAGLATVIAQAFVFICGLAFFLQRENRPHSRDFALDGEFLRRTLKGGFAPFALTLLPEVTTIVMNMATEAHGGATAQSAFAVISYVAVAIQWIIQGVNDGSQPLVSLRFGEGKLSTMRALRHTNYVFAVGIGLAGMVALYVLRVPLAVVFGISPETSEVFYHGVALFSLALGLYGITHAITSFFYAVESSRNATIVILGEVVLVVFFAAVLPLFLGLDGVWLAVVATQACLAVLAVALLRHSRGNIAQAAARHVEKHAELAGQAAESNA